MRVKHGGAPAPKYTPVGAAATAPKPQGAAAAGGCRGGPLPRSVRPHNPPSADARPPRGVLGLFVCPLPQLPAAESPRILPAWEAPGLVFSTGAPRLSGWGEMSARGRGTSWGPGLPGGAGSIRGCWGAGMLWGGLLMACARGWLRVCSISFPLIPCPTWGSRQPRHFPERGLLGK